MCIDREYSSFFIEGAYNRWNFRLRRLFQRARLRTVLDGVLDHWLVLSRLLTESILDFDGSLVKTEYIYGACLLVFDTGICLLVKIVAVVTRAFSV